LYPGEFLGLPIAIPPVEEQREIADHIREQAGRTDEAIAVARRGIRLAKERRAALISAAVTGKIDIGAMA
jgi:type I restriction enzyme S subunit